MAVVSSEGALTRIEKPAPASQWWWSGQVNLNDRWTDYAQIWTTQPNVRTVVSFLGRNIAQLGLKVFRRRSDTIREQLNDHPLALTLRHPNTFTTQYRLIDALVQSIALYDNALWVKVATDAGVGVTQIPWWRVQIIGDNFLEPAAYRVTGNQAYVDVPRDRVVHFRGFNPSDPRQGVSPMETLRRILNEEASAGDYRQNFWKNAARSSVWLQRPAGVKASPESKERFAAQWQAFYAGSSNAGKSPVLEDGIEVKEWPSFSAEDSQYIESRRLTREEVAAAFHVPPPMVGVLDHATFSNIDTQHRMLYQDTLGPWLTMIEQEIELQLLPEYEDQGNIYVEFNLAEKLKGSFEERARALREAVGGPYLSPDEARALENRPPIAGGDRLYPPANASSNAAPAALADGVTSKADAVQVGRLRDYFDAMSRTVLSEIGAKKTQNVDDVFYRPRWDLKLRELDVPGVDAEQVNASIRAALADALASAKPLEAARDIFEQAKTVWAETLAPTA